MRQVAAGGASSHLTYCTNIHAGESWQEVARNIDEHVRQVKRLVSPDAPFGVGLRLSALAAAALAQPDTIAAFREYLGREGLYVFTLNGFPYGPFHGTPVKEQVYEPDWLSDARLEYTDCLAHILAALLPRDMGPLVGSISSVPGCYRPRAAGLPDAEEHIARRLVRHVHTLVRIAEEGGPVLGLALEPEPFCLWQTTGELLSFFDRVLFTDRAAAWLSELTGSSRATCAGWLRRHLGMCLDACHAAVEFEDVSELTQQLRASEVPVWKLQVSAGLRVTTPSRRALEALEPFAEGVYLHQTVVRHGEILSHYRDLPEVLAAARSWSDLGDEWRVHFHVPVFDADFSELGPGIESTGTFLRELLAHHARAALTSHLEVETYTWDVLPRALRTQGLDEAIARELSWTAAQLGGVAGASRP